MKGLGGTFSSLVCIFPQSTRDKKNKAINSGVLLVTRWGVWVGFLKEVRRIFLIHVYTRGVKIIFVKQNGLRLIYFHMYLVEYFLCHYSGL